MNKLALLILPLLVSGLAAQQPAAPPAPKEPPPKAYADPAETDADFPFQGEYAGERDGKKYGLQILALGGGKFEAVTFKGGLPGDGWDGDRSKVVHATTEKAPEAGVLVFLSPDKELTATVDGKTVQVVNKAQEIVFELSRQNRQSPTLGATPPPDAIVLFGGKDQNGFPGSQVTEDGLLIQGATSAEAFGDFTLHIEFRLPYTPTGRGQKRGNSGIYLQSRYEVQMLDSFGLDGKDNECGGLYKIAAPKVNMCLPPLVWQTYDIDFTAARFDASGTKTASAQITVRHNGVVIHDRQELPSVTGGAKLPEDANPGPILLQNHGDPVRYRNIWLVKKA